MNIMGIVVQSIFLFILALLLALVEIEAEGKHGWAEKMPTWYRTNGYVARIYGLIMGNRPLTGYHLYMFVLTPGLFHIGYLTGQEWSWVAELKTLSIFITWATMWDFLWFPFNPHYGLKNFKPGKIWWHDFEYWLYGKFPISYFIATVTSIILIIIANYLQNGLTNPTLLIEHLVKLTCWLVLIPTSLIFTSSYHSWYWKMRRSDDRNKVNFYSPKR